MTLQLTISNAVSIYFIVYGIILQSVLFYGIQAYKNILATHLFKMWSSFIFLVVVKKSGYENYII